MTTIDIEQLAASIDRKDWRAVITATCGSNHLALTQIWACAMTAYFGPTRLHEGWLGEDGRPTAHALETFPRLVHEMHEAEVRIPQLLDWYRRQLAA
jgi:hypothetical protein